MNKLIVTADVHGSLGSWLTLKQLVNKGDALVIAGDLFDTRYGNYSDRDFQPEALRKDLRTFGHPVRYVYGNCDVPSFYQGFEHTLTFSQFGKSFFMHHGHRPADVNTAADVIIQGHTHLCALEKSDGRIYMNPGSISCPRNGVYTYGIIDRKGAALVELKSGEIIFSLEY